jgi:lipoate-protein ligase A
VFHEDTIGFAWTIRDDAPRDHVIGRFEEIADIMAKALLRLGVDARVGEVAGEYCPGAYSVNARGATKLMGVGQRTILKAAHVGGVVVVGGSDRIRSVLVPVYDALGLQWNPDTTGSVQDETSGVTYLDAQQAIVDEFASRYELAEGTLARDTVALAEELEPEHLAVLSPSR